MQIELDISLKNPLNKIDLEQVFEKLKNNKKYILILFQRNNFMSLDVCRNNVRIRIHEDGRLYIKMDINYEDSLDDGRLLKYMINTLCNFIIDVNIYGEDKWEKEFNFGVHGNLAHGFLWKNFDAIGHFSRRFLNCETMKLYASKRNSVYVKLAY